VARVGLHQPHRIGLSSHPLDALALDERNLLVVADCRPVVRELDQHGLAAHRGEHGLPADARTLGDRVDRGGGVPALREQLAGRGDDLPPRAARLLRAQVRPVGPLVRSHELELLSV